MGRGAAIGLVFALIAAAAQVAAAQVAAGPVAVAQVTSVVPGRAVGALRIGEDVAPVVDALGPLHSREDLPAEGLAGYYWPLKRIGVIVDKTSRKIVALAVSLDERYQTDRGVAPGAAIDAVRAAYGREDTLDERLDDMTLIYDKLGVAFVVNRGGVLGSRVSVIFIFGSGRYHDIFVD